MAFQYAHERQEYRVDWYSTDGIFHSDFFVYVGRYPQSIDVHVCEDPTSGVREFLENLPLHNVRVSSI